jgi:hypothetical protein
MWLQFLHYNLKEKCWFSSFLSMVSIRRRKFLCTTFIFSFLSDNRRKLGIPICWEKKNKVKTTFYYWMSLNFEKSRYWFIRRNSTINEYKASIQSKSSMAHPFLIRKEDKNKERLRKLSWKIKNELDLILINDHKLSDSMISLVWSTELFNFSGLSASDLSY